MRLAVINEIDTLIRVVELAGSLPPSDNDHLNIAVDNLRDHLDRLHKGYDKLMNTLHDEIDSVMNDEITADYQTVVAALGAVPGVSGVPAMASVPTLSYSYSYSSSIIPPPPWNNNPSNLSIT